ncbi:MAG TPA: hypothetical protein VKX46_22995 [Ktedonobacteraceae bacterium]|nr:hypothetical protein [Ktedonobacteraceae bacterium]
MSESEIACFKRRQLLQDEAAQQGLCGLAAVARHDFIVARMERETADLIQLIQDGHIDQVERIIAQMQQEVRRMQAG